MDKSHQDRFRILVVDDEEPVLEAYRAVLFFSGDRGRCESRMEELDGDPLGSRHSKTAIASFDLALCHQGDEAVEIVRASVEENRPFAVAFLDVRLPPGPDGVWTAERIRALDRNMQIVIVTAYSDIDPAEISRRVQPTDRLLYLQKPFHAQEIRQFVKSLSAKWSAEKRLREVHDELERRVQERTAELGRVNEQLQKDIAERDRAQEAAREREMFLSNIFASIQDGISVLDRDYTVVRVNPAIEQWHADAVPIAGKKCHEAYHGRSTPCEVCPTRQTFETGQTAYGVCSTKTPTGEVAGWFDIYTFPLLDTDTGQVEGVIEYVRDVSDRRRLEQQLLQAQKMESIGTLAGGIAHDFNNLLSGILGYASLTKTKISENHQVFEYVDTIEKSAIRAAELTAQLLAFARGGKYEVEPVNVNQIVDETMRIIGRTFHKSIEIETRLHDPLPTVDADGGQLQQMLMNLCVNAADAMMDGGTLVIETGVETLTRDHAKSHMEAKPGSYVTLSVIDTGTGMGDETLERIFEPFFTTKEEGKGTGLGLAMVYGVVRNHGGSVHVSSKPGEGSTFKVYLPVKGKPSVQKRSATETPRNGSELILIVDDEKAIRSLARDMLESYGYSTLVAQSGAEAVEIYGKHKDEIGLVILDMVMPKKGGRETFLELKKLNPEVKTLLSTGYGENGKAKEILGIGVMGFVQKPYDVASLLSKVRSVLDEKS